MLLCKNFVITRIIGNNVPKRDIIPRTKIFNFILKNEIKTDKIWILNRIYNKNYLNYLKEIFKNYPLFEIEFNFEDFKKIKSERDQLHYITNINNARNYSFKIAKNLGYKNIAIFDGDCMINEENFYKFLKIYKKEKKMHYGMCAKRFYIQEIKKIEEKEKEEEEISLIFNHNSNFTFNENISYREGSKIELLYKLGYKHGKFVNQLENENLCKNIGFLYHLNTGNEKLEKSSFERNQNWNNYKKNMIKEVYDYFNKL